MAKVKVLLAITRMSLGGAPRHVLSLASGLDRNRYEVWIATGHEDRGEGSLLEEARSSGVGLAVVPGLRRKPSPSDDLKALVWMYRFMTSERFHIVHTHTSKAGTLGRLAGRLAGVPVSVHTFHGNIFEGFFGSLSSSLFLLLERAMAKLTDRLVAVSSRNLSYFVSKRIAPRRKFRLIYNGVDPEMFSGRDKIMAKRALGLPNGPAVGTVAALVPVKGLDYFLEAARYVSLEVPEASFVVAGGGALEGALRRRAEDLGVEVRFLGPRKDVPLVLSALEVFVLPSLSEGMGLSIMEAMAAGLPVVATEVGGIPELVVDGETGVLVPPRDPEALARAILECIRERERAEEMGRKGRKRVRDLFTLARMIREHEILYEELLSCAT